MNHKQLEEQTKAFPAKIKQDNAALVALQKALGTLSKPLLASKKETDDICKLFQGFDQSKEISQNFITLYQDYRSAYTIISEVQANKVQKYKDLQTQVQEFVIQNTASAKEIAEKAAANSLSGNTILFADLARIKKHKKLLQDMMYQEMNEHAILLEQYAKMFEDTQKKVNIYNEFKGTMVAGGKFPTDQINEYLSVKVGRAQAQELGSLMRGQNTAGLSQANQRSQSQQKTPQRMQLGSDTSFNSSQRGKSQAPAPVNGRSGQ